MFFAHVRVFRLEHKTVDFLLMSILVAEEFRAGFRELMRGRGVGVCKLLLLLGFGVNKNQLARRAVMREIRQHFRSVGADRCIAVITILQ